MSLVLVGHVPTLIAWLVLRLGYFSSYLAAVVAKSDGFAQVAAGFAFSMLGFMAAVMALFSILGQSRAFRLYRQNGLLKLLMIGIAITLAELAATFVASLRLFMVSPLQAEDVQCVLLALLASLGMVLVTATPIVGLQIRAASEK